jgi:hypothetical protein
MGADLADTVEAGNSLEKMLVHLQIARACQAGIGDRFWTFLASAGVGVSGKRSVSFACDRKMAYPDRPTGA